MITLDELRAAGTSSVLFECIAGSLAYGTSTTASDEDIRGIFAVPATSYMDLVRPPDQISDERGNMVYYSLRRVVEPTPDRFTYGPLTATELLRRWLQNDGTAERYRGCHKLLINLTPPELRFEGYEDVIRERSTRQQQEPTKEGVQVVGRRRA